MFTPAERARLGEGPLSERVRWSLWAAKESAFKAARKLHPDIPFHPREFAVRLFEDARERLDHVREDLEEFEVVHRVAGRFHVWLDGARDWVHAVAAPAAEAMSRPPALVAFLDELEFPDLPDPRERVRELARLAVASMMSLDPNQLRVVTDENGIPRLVVEGDDPLPVDLSLSHHGRLVACSWSGTD